MTKYLLQCDCGKTVSVEIGQAGERVACECGATLDVPPLRKLRHLPTAKPAVAQKAAPWNARLGIIAASLILAVTLAIVALWNRLAEPPVPRFDVATGQQATQAMDEGLKTMTPVESWRRWVEFYRPMADRGLARFESPSVPIIEQEIARRRFLQKTLLAVAGVLIAVAVVTAFWPQAKTGRQGDKETSRKR